MALHDLYFRTIDDKGKPSWGEEVEPPENMDWIHYDIDPRMRIWKSMTGSGQDKQPLKAEQDLDELYHPSGVDRLQDQIQNLDLPSNVQAEQEDISINYRQEPEEDRDDIDHPVFREVAAEEPKQDQDEVYRKAREELAGYLAPLVLKKKVDAAVYAEEKNEDLHELRSEREVRVHLQPEEDMDDIYHKDILMPVLQHDDTKVAAAVDSPFQRKYSEPEEDLDDLYHH